MQRAQQHSSTTISCSSAPRAYIRTLSNTRNAGTAQYAVESPSRSPSLRTGQSSASSKCLSKSRTCEYSFSWPLLPCDQCPPSQIKKPSLSTPTKNIYLQAPPQLEAATRPNLEKEVSEFVPDGGEVTVTATSLPFSLSLCITYTPKSL